MAVVRNITKEALSLGDRVVPADGEVDIANEDFAGHAWPSSTWELVTKPGKGYRRDSDVTDAIVFHPADAETPETDEENA